MFYSYTNLIHKHTAGFDNKISPQCSLSNPSTAYCISQYGTKRKAVWRYVAPELRGKAPSVTKLLNSRRWVMRRGKVDVTPANAFAPRSFNPLNPELNPICYLLALLGAHHFLHVSRIRVKLLTFRLLMSYIYGAPILDVSRSHTTTQHSR